MALLVSRVEEKSSLAVVMDVGKQISLSSYNQFDNKGSLNIYHNKRRRGLSYPFFLIAKPFVFHVFLFFFNLRLCFKAFKKSCRRSVLLSRSGPSLNKIVERYRKKLAFLSSNKLFDPFSLTEV